jgi:guanosine-3',5'-bis(diphosphate) 3'-pyrophosphohydrolase
VATLEKALEIAARAHSGQRDKEGLPYILHPLRVMSRVNGEPAQIVAVLHDVVEDTSVTLDDLRAAGFTPEVIEAVTCVTHRREEPYAEYVIRCRDNPLARQVKLADLEDNSLLSRAILRRDREAGDLARLRRYTLSYKLLTGQLGVDEYRAWMATGTGGSPDAEPRAAADGGA